MKRPQPPLPIFHRPADSPKYSPFIIQTAGPIHMQRSFRLSVRAPGVDQAFGCCLVRMVIRLITDRRVAESDESATVQRGSQPVAQEAN